MSVLTIRFISLNLPFLAAIRASSLINLNCPRPAPFEFKCSPVSSVTKLRKMSTTYGIIEKGQPNTTTYRLYLSTAEIPISPFHDIPLFADEPNKIYNMVVEVPRWTNAKMEIATKEPLNPIKQDTKKDALRFVKNVFPHHGYIWNYGALPQTWEDPNHIDESTSCRGDNDPIDVCEIGERVHKRGAVVKVKILGVFALIDEGETDWKLLAIDVNDPLAKSLNDLKDIETAKPGILKATQEWFRWYKVPDGKPQNKFAFDGKPMDRAFAEQIIKATHESWKKLITSTPESPVNTFGLDLKCVSISNSPFQIEDPQNILEDAPPPAPAMPMTEEEKQAIDKFYHVGL